ncbi:MAG: cell division FtsA domain-containing protein [Candidatus Omnitrophota bacterium]
MFDKKDLIFSLDIGTRKVVGIVAQKNESSIQVIDVEVVEHSSRTMLDGQIHNINEVAKIVDIIKGRLEKRLDISLHKVGVAVAGRALRTVHAKIAKDLSLDEEITEDAVRNLELEAVSSVLHEANHDFGQGDYYCVGYSVVYYELDSAVMGNLVGHFGRNMAVEVIATFLPRVVLDSMLSVLRKTGLEVINLTLEPIAAINIMIPQDMRRLNLVLVDIGAGTSDIALTRGGSVVAYGMVPEAGDEITELICEKFILDFTSAEKIKRLVSSQAKVEFQDILGKSYRLDSQDIIEVIHDRVQALARSISDCILELNQNVPHAVILVGGGSLTPLLNKAIACALPLDENKVGIRMPEMIQGVQDKTGKLKGPDMVTPIGISVMTAQSRGLKFIDLYVNEKRIHVLDMQQNMDIISALVAAGVDKYKLYGKIGKAICVELNGQLKIIKGKTGRPARFKLNDKPAELTDSVKNQDRITFEGAQDGEDAMAKVKDIIDVTTIRVMVNEEPVEIKPRIFINDVLVTEEEDLVDRACIEFDPEFEVREVLEKAGINTLSLEDREIVVRVNKEPRILTQSNYNLMIEGKRATLNSKVIDGSVIEFDKEHAQFYRVKDVVEVPENGRNIRVVFNDKQCMLDGNHGKIFMNGQKVDADEFLIDRAEIITKPGGNMLPTVSHLLKYFPVDSDEYKGKILKIAVNGEPGGFTTQLSEGAEVTICFVHR